MQDYRLIRVSVSENLTASSRCGFGINFPPLEPLLRLWRRMSSRAQACLRRRRQKRERTKLGEQLREELAPLLDERDDNMLVYAEGVPEDCWVRTLLPLPEFDRYLDKKWLQELLPYARHAHFIVLGNASCVQELLCGLAPRMKSLLWVAPDLTYGEQLEEFAEDFFQEYGLAIDLHFLPDNGTYGQIRIREERYSEPVNVLDFTGQKYIPLFHPPAGSIWLDMAAVREKELRIESRRLRCTYFSLRKIWRGLLDTEG